MKGFFLFMNKTRMIMILAMLVTAAASLCARADQEMSFIVMGDSRPILATLSQSPPFRHILWETDLIGPDLAVHVGDLVFGYMSRGGELSRQYQDLRQTLDPVRTPMHFAIGNHEIGSDGGRDEYNKAIGPTFYSFDIKGSHFIMLDSDCCGAGDTGTLGPAQFDWLKADLAKAKQATNVFIFMHKPMFDDATSPGGSFNDTAMRDAMHSMFLEADNVRAVFAGHVHIYRGFTRDGIPYYITGGAGAETEHPEREGFYHYLLVNVNGTNLDVRVVEPYHLWYECEPACNGANATVTVTLVNSLYSNMPLRLRGVTVDMPAPAPGKTYRAKGARITASRDNGNGAISLRINALLNSVVGYLSFTLEQVDAH